MARGSTENAELMKYQKRSLALETAIDHELRHRDEATSGVARRQVIELANGVGHVITCHRQGVLDASRFG